MSHTIEQELHFAVSPERAYQALVTASEFSAMSGGAPTEIDATPGGAFSCFGGMITGRTLHCVPGKLLVQAWRAKTWPEGDFSIVRFDFASDGDGSKVNLTHTAFPDGQHEHLAAGWHANYWEPLAKVFGA